jgi:Flp pilus assembly pilin Flp
LGVQLLRDEILRPLGAGLFGPPSPGREGRRSPWILKAARSFFGSQDGVSIVEYALLLALIALICLAGMSIIGNKINNITSSLSTTI